MPADPPVTIAVLGVAGVEGAAEVVRVAEVVGVAVAGVAVAGVAVAGVAVAGVALAKVAGADGEFVVSGCSEVVMTTMMDARGCHGNLVGRVGSWRG
jgi:hypothetical protein